MAITYVKSDFGENAASGTALNAVFGSNIASNSLIVAAFRWEGTDTTLTLTDTRGIVWTEISRQLGVVANVAVFAGLSPASGAETVTMTLGVAKVNRFLAVHEYTHSGNRGLADMIHKSAKATLNTSGTFTVGPIVTTFAGCLIFAFDSNGDGVTYTPTDGGTTEETGVTIIDSETWDRTQVSAGSTSSTATVSALSDNAGIIVAFTDAVLGPFTPTSGSVIFKLRSSTWG